MPALTDHLAELAGWLVTLSYLSYFAYRYFNDIEYELLQRSKDNKDGLFETLRIQPAYPRWLVSPLGYWTWFVAFLLYVLTLYFVAQMVLDSFTHEEVEAISKDNPWLSTFPQLTAAFVVSGIVAGIPKIDALLSIARSVCHRSAAIPTRAMTIVNHIHNHRIDLNSAQIQKAINAADGSALESDATAAKGSPPYQWAVICFFIAWLREARQPNTVYAAVMARPDIGFDALETQFRKTCKHLNDIKSTNKDRFTHERTREEIDILFDRAIQTFVCILLSSESTYADAKAKLQKEGVISSFLKDYEPSMFFAILGIFVIFLVLFAAGFIVQGLFGVSKPVCQGVEPLGDASYALGVGLGVTVMMSLPALSVFMLKAALARQWPLRLPGMPRQTLIYLGSLLFGTVQGAIWLFMIGYYGIIDFGRQCNADWYIERLPWVVLTGITCATVALAVDRIPVVKSVWNVSRRALASGILLGFAFFLIALVIKIVDLDVSFEQMRDMQFWRENLSKIVTIILIVGAFLAIYISVISDLSTGFSSADSEKSMYVASLILPVLGNRQVAPEQIDEDLCLEQSDFASAKAFRSLKSKGIIMPDDKIAGKYMDDLRTYRRRELS